MWLHVRLHVRLDHWLDPHTGVTDGSLWLRSVRTTAAGGFNYNRLNISAIGGFSHVQTREEEEEEDFDF